jgi:hypothetical protein
MENKDIIEFYDGRKMISSVYSSMVPAVNAKINIAGKNWVVFRVNYALDYASTIEDRAMCAAVELLGGN